jgi:acyl-CoA synthetase (AMP-forming)/AMP-acid ligase II/pimeloyl-ACP methyl ester carboxylesterase
MKTANCHHGSPGTVDDFNDILNDLSLNTNIINRYHGENSPSADISIGYSFGSFYAIADAYHGRAEAIILISPYLYPQGQMPKVKKTVLSLPILSDILLKKAAPVAIEKMLSETSYPKAVSERYKRDGEKYKNPKCLRPALFEKDIALEQLPSMLAKIKKTGIPVFVIRGDKDQTALRGEQYERLARELQIKEIIIKEAGHAIPWTHTEKLKEALKEVLNLIEKRPDELKKPAPNAAKFGYFPGENKDNNVSAFLTKHLSEIPDRPILKWVDQADIAKWDKTSPLPHRSATVSELNEIVARIAYGLKNLGIKKGDRVIIFIPMSFPLYAAMFAVQRIGAIATFLDSWARRDQMGLAAEVVEASAMISVERAFQYLGLEEQIAKIPLKICVGPATEKYSARLEALMQSPGQTEACPVESEHTALITFTTGSSGTPKGADRTHRFLAAQHYALNRHIPYNEGDSDLPVFPIFSLNNLAAGVTTVIPAIDVGAPAENDAAVLIAQMKSTGTTCTTLSPSLLRGLYTYCLDNHITLPFLRRIVTGGAPVSKDDLKKTLQIAPQSDVLVLYGSTEVEPMAHIEARDMLTQSENPDQEWVEEGVNVGHFDDGLQVRFLKIFKDAVVVNKASDWDSLIVPEGQVGEVIVAGEHVCQGYFNNEEAFHRAKIRDENGVVWHRTGDLGRFDSDKNLWLVGRVHNAINRAGTYLFPVRAEIVMKKVKGVQHAAFLGMPHSELEESPWAVFSCLEGVDPQQVSSEVKRLLEKNGIIADKVCTYSKIPMDPRHHSKVEYSVLRELLLQEQSL